MNPPSSNKTTTRHYTALARLVAPSRDASPSQRSWKLHKNLRGQEPWEIYTIAAIIGTTTVAATIQQASQHLALGGWHWLWIAPAAIVASFAIFQAVAIACAIFASLLGSCGFMPNSDPGTRTSFFFLSTFTAYAAWAATSGTWVAPLGYLWLALVSLNIIAAVWLAMREHETRH